MDMQSHQSTAGLPAVEGRSGGGLEFTSPTAGDGPEVHRLIAACPPLDQNSLYCNLLQCTHWADTCVAAWRGGQLVGWVSAYRLPQDPETLFVWQVAVGAEARGQGLAAQMLDHLLARRACLGVRRLETSITPDNAASWRLFMGVARGLSAPLSEAPWFIKGEHFPNGHDSEHLVRIGPFDPPAGDVRAGEPRSIQELQPSTHPDTNPPDTKQRKGDQHV